MSGEGYQSQSFAPDSAYGDAVTVDSFGANDRTPPQDLLSEQSVLGGMMINKDAVAVALEQVKAEDFYQPKHEIVFEAIFDLYAKGEPTDVIAVTDELTKSGKLQRAGGAEYLHTLTSIVPTAANVGYYANIVREKSTLRKLVETGTMIAQLGYNATGEVEDLVNQAQAEVYGITEDEQSEEVKPLARSVDAAIARMEERQQGEGGGGVLTGITELDRLTGGLQPGQLVVVAARPGMGKSTLALDFARSAAIGHNQPAVIYSLEMGDAELASRLLSAESGVELWKLLKGFLAASEWRTITGVRAKVADAPLYIDDSPNLTLVEIRAKSRRLKQQGDLKLIVIDYLQLMTSGKKVESRQQEVAEFSRALKLLAKELEVPIVALSQLNRGPEQRPDKRPQLGDLRESGAIEQDADIVIMVHRDLNASAEEGANSGIGEADLIVAKNRNGATTTIKVAFQGHLSRFANLANFEPPMPAAPPEEF